MLLEALQLIVRAETMTVIRAGSPLGVWRLLLLLLLRSILLLLLLLLGNAEWRLRQGLLAELRLLLRAEILELVVHRRHRRRLSRGIVDRCVRLVRLEPRRFGHHVLAKGS